MVGACSAAGQVGETLQVPGQGWQPVVMCGQHQPYQPVRPPVHAADPVMLGDARTGPLGLQREVPLGRVAEQAAPGAVGELGWLGAQHYRTRGRASPSCRSSTVIWWRSARISASLSRSLIGSSRSEWTLGELSAHPASTETH
jgi:hypothetical protein